MQGRGHLTPLRRVQSGQVIKKRHAISPLVVLTCVFSVELPGIELGTDISLTCGNNAIGDAKARETTWRDLRAYRSVLMTSTLRLARCVPVGRDFEMGRQ